MPDVNDYVYGTHDLIEVIEPLFAQQPSLWLLEMMFPRMDVQETAEIHLDRLPDDRRISAFVAPAVPATPRDQIGFETDVFRPAYIKERDRLLPEQMLKRMPGEPIGGAMSAEQRARGHIGMLAIKQRSRIRRRLQLMASDYAMNGSLTITGDKYPTKTVSFGRDAGMRVTLAGAARWGEVGVSPLNDVDSWQNTYGEINGAAPADVVMTPDAWDYFKESPKLDRVLDRQLGQTPLIDLGFTGYIPNGPVYKGRIGNVRFWVYNETYTDLAGVKQNLLPPYTVLLLSREVIDGWQAFGMIHDFGALAAMDMFTKTWPNQDPSALNILTQTAPLLVPARPDGVMAITVR